MEVRNPMSKSFSLDDIRQAAEARYGHTEIEGLKLRNVMRLSKDERNSLIALQERQQEDDADVEALLREAIVLVADNKDAAGRLCDEIGDDLAVLSMIFEKYTEGTEVGEA